MSRLPDKRQQIVQAHAVLIRQVVMACLNRDLRPALEPLLQASAENGWTDLVAAIRLILGGRRDPGVLVGLDEEDSAIVQAILLGLQNPATLADPNVKPDPAFAAPGLAAMIHAAVRGNIQALQLIANMAEQMSQFGGDMAKASRDHSAPD
jgi:hypothetical protein